MVRLQKVEEQNTGQVRPLHREHDFFMTSSQCLCKQTVEEFNAWDNLTPLAILDRLLELILLKFPLDDDCWYRRSSVGVSNGLSAKVCLTHAISQCVLVLSFVPCTTTVRNTINVP